MAGYKGTLSEDAKAFIKKIRRKRKIFFDKNSIKERYKVLEELMKEKKSNEQPKKYESVEHPQHYGGKDNPYEAIKVIEAWGLDFNLGNTVKYISRCGKKPGQDMLQDLKKAQWYLEREIDNINKNNNE